MVDRARTGGILCGILRYMQLQLSAETETQHLGYLLGQTATGGLVLELVGDIGVGKTTLTKGVARGLGITEAVQSPTFTISRVYEASHSRQLAHYDFYRLPEPGIMAQELADTSRQPDTVTVIEWAESVSEVLPADRLRLLLQATGQQQRAVQLQSGGVRSAAWLEQVRRAWHQQSVVSAEEGQR